MAATVPLIGSGLGYKSLTVNAQRRLNVYLEPQQDQDKGQVAVYGRPGLAQVLSGSTPVRMMIENGDGNLIAFIGDTFYVYANHDFSSPVATNTDYVGVPDVGLMDVADSGTISLMTNIYTPVAGIKNSELVANRRTVFISLLSVSWLPDEFTVWEAVAYMDGYFIASKVGQSKFYWKLEEDFLSGDFDTRAKWGALDFLSAESFSDPILRLKAKNNYLIVFGTKGTEFWSTQASSDAPFQPVKGLAQPWGLAAKWSLAETQSGFIFLGRSAMGKYHLCKMAGTTITPIINHEFDAVLASIAAGPGVESAEAFSVDFDGHLFYFVTFPHSGQSWLFDANLDTFCEVETGGSIFRGRIGTGWKGRSYCSGQLGGIYRIDPTKYTDDGTTIERELITRHFWKDLDRVIVDEFRIDFEAGVGLTVGQGSNPQVMLSVSKDNGKTWGNEMWTTIGAIGEYKARAVWRRLGIGRDWLFKIRMTDPVKFTIAGMSIRAQPVGS